MNLVLDTNRYIDFQRGDLEALNILMQASRIYIPFAVLGELQVGFSASNHNNKNKNNFKKFIEHPNVHTLYANFQTSFYYASVYHQLRKQGTPIPTNDMWIAALVLQHDFVLYARDKHFDHLPQLQRI